MVRAFEVLPRTERFVIAVHGNGVGRSAGFTVGKVLGNPVFQGVTTVVVCSTTGPGGCAAVSYGFAAYNSGVRFAEDEMTKRSVGLAAVDFALAGLKLNKAESVVFEKTIGPGVYKFAPYGTNAVKEVVRKSAGRIIVKNVVVTTGAGVTSYVINQVAG